MLKTLRPFGSIRANFSRLLSTEAAESAAAEQNSSEKAAEKAPPSPNEDGTFRVLEIPGTRKREFTRGGFDHANAAADGMKKRLFPSTEPRFKRMSPKTTKWPAIWPSAQSFKWSVVPLPVRQGYVKRAHGVVPGKYANAELMKIPNFFHLTPEHIRKHCNAIKQFCTEWPCELDTDAKCEENFPVEISTSSYCHAGPSIRHPNARKVTMRVPFSRLGELDFHAKDKILRLLGCRFDPSNGFVTISTDRCPTSRQNYDYAMYLLTAVYYESWKIEDWERNKSQQDLGKYYWHLSTSRQHVVDYVRRLTTTTSKSTTKDENSQSPFGDLPENASDVDIVRHPLVSNYQSAVTDLFNNGETHESLHNYRAAVERLLGLPKSKFAQ